MNFFKKLELFFTSDDRRIRMLTEDFMRQYRKVEANEKGFEIITTKGKQNRVLWRK